MSDDYIIGMMFRIACKSRLRGILWIRRNVSASSAPDVPPDKTLPNTPLDLDPSLQSLLKDANISLTEHKNKTHHAPPMYRELETIPTGRSVAADVLHGRDSYRDSVGGHRDSRKSPAADFGSHRIGAVTLPVELQASINRMITGIW